MSSSGTASNTEGLVNELLGRLGEAFVTVGAQVPQRQRRDSWVHSELSELLGEPAPPPLCRVRPASEEQVVQVVQACARHQVALVPQGLLSGVCGGVLSEERVVLLDMSGMSTIHGIDTQDSIGDFDAGVRGSDAEAACNERGLSLGHFPQSMELSSVGGWVATRAAGQYSTGYGNIEDMLIGLTAVLPDGRVLAAGDYPRGSLGPDLRQLLLGSEGRLGVITRVRLALRRQAQHRHLAAFYLPDMRSGFELQREMLQSGYSPTVLRQYDPPEVGRLFSKFRKPDRCLLLALVEGAEPVVRAHAEGMAQLASEAGAEDAPAQAVEHWLRERNHVPSFESFLKNGIVVDTIEVSAPYSRIGDVYDAAVKGLSEVKGIWNGSAHSSHAYRTGLNLYFSFAAQAKGLSAMRETYQRCWSAVMEATLSNGGCVSHHHGIGRVRKAWLSRQLGQVGTQVLRQVCESIDPEGIMNPGALLSDDRP